MCSLCVVPVAKRSHESQQKMLRKIFGHQPAGHIADKPCYSLLAKNVKMLVFLAKNLKCVGSIYISTSLYRLCGNNREYVVGNIHCTYELNYTVVLRKKGPVSNIRPLPIISCKGLKLLQKRPPNGPHAQNFRMQHDARLVYRCTENDVI